MYETKRDEAGSALIMVLVVLVFVAVVVLSALTYSVTSVKSSNQALIPARTRLYDADSAMQAAIQYVKQDQKNGGSLGKDTGRPCPPSPGADPASTFVYPGASAVAALNAAVNNSQTTVSVNSTSNFPTSGQFVIVIDSEDMLVTAGQGTTSWTVTRGYLGTPAAAHTSGSSVRIGITVNICPQFDSFNLAGSAHAALLTLAPTGQGIVQTKNTTLTVSGDVWSNSFVDVRALNVIQGKLWSWNDAALGGDCASGNVTVAAGKDCSANATFGFTTLSAAITTTAQTTISVASNAKFPQSGQYAIAVDNEKMLVTGGQGTNTWTVTRGFDGTTAATHANGNSVGFMPKTGVDPGQPYLQHAADWQPAAAPGAVRTPSSCTLSPGVYLHGDDLSALWGSPLSCSTLNLLPGVYYLDFPPDGTPSSKSGTDDTWSINGTLQGPNPSCAAGDPGAQIVLANASKITNSEEISIPCAARASAGAPRIAFMGFRTGAGSTVTVLKPSHAADAGGGFFSATASNAANGGNPLYPQDLTQARASVSSSGATANLQLDTFAATSGPALTSSSLVTSLMVKVAHDESNSNVNFTTTAPKLVWGSCTINLAPVPTRSASETLYASDDLSSGLSGCAFDPSTSPALTWSVKTTSASPVNIDVDGAQLDVTTGVAAQTGCVVHGGCPIIQSGSANGHDKFKINDVVYLPDNQFQNTCKNFCDFYINDALISWSLDLDANPAAIGPPVIGGATHEFTLGKVLFRAFIGANEWTDVYATLDGSTFKPTINSWVNAH